MWLSKLFKRRRNQRYDIEETEEYAEEELTQEEEITEIKFVYFALDKPKDDILNSITKNIQTFTVESECIEYIKSITDKIFLIIDGLLSSTFCEEIEKLPQIISVFIYSSSSNDSVKSFSEQEHPYLVYLCENKDTLSDSIKKSREELDEHSAAFTTYNRNEKFSRNISRESGSYLCFQVFKNAVLQLPKTIEAKKDMIIFCRNYYRGNSNELANINEFEMCYKSDDAIAWFLKDCFLYKLINKGLRTERAIVLYQFHFFILDLSEQIQSKCLELRKKQNTILHLYGGVKLNKEEVINYQNSIGYLISINEYLLTSDQRSVAHNDAINGEKDENTVRVLFEYKVDLNKVKNIVLAGVREYSPYPEINQYLFDFGSTFQIHSGSYNTEEDLWYFQLHAIDCLDKTATEYVEHEKKIIMESNIYIKFGNLLIDMGEYREAERYFNNLLNSSLVTDEDIGSIYYNLGRTHRLRGQYSQTINCYNRAYNLHLNSSHKNLHGAASAANGLGIVYMEQGKSLKAKESFQRAIEIYEKDSKKNSIETAATLINLGTIDSDEQQYSEAMSKFRRAQKIYDRSLPVGHPNHALPRVNLGNVYVAVGDYNKAREEYEAALKIQQASLPTDHLDIIRTLHNIAVVYVWEGKIELAKEYLKRVEEMASRTVSATHPIMKLINDTKDKLSDLVDLKGNMNIRT